MKTVVLAVSGCIAAYKALEVLSALKKRNFNVKVLMTEHATQFVTPLSFETLSRNKVILGMFDDKERYEVEHVSLATEAAAFVVVPATANIIAKLATGVADDMVTTTALSMPAKTPKIIAPAMNVVMFENEATVRNLEVLKQRGWIVVEPEVGMLACNVVGKGHLAAVADITAAVSKAVLDAEDYIGRTVLVTAGGTEEPIDPVRVITNRSSGKQGVALAEAVENRGGRAILVAANVSVKLPQVYKTIRVKTTADMALAVLANFDEADTFILAGAPSDYRPMAIAEAKIKSQELSLTLIKNPDIAKSIGEKKCDKKLAIFAAETENLVENANKKLQSKNADLVVANDVSKKGVGFDGDTNAATIIARDGRSVEVSLTSKVALAGVILDWLK